MKLFKLTFAGIIAACIGYIMCITVIVILIGGYIITKCNYVGQYGLKTVVEEVWYGQDRTK